MKDPGEVELEMLVNILCDFIGQFELLVVKFYIWIALAWPQLNVIIGLKVEGSLTVSEEVPQTIVIVIC